MTVPVYTIFESDFEIILEPNSTEEWESNVLLKDTTGVFA